MNAPQYPDVSVGLLVTQTLDNPPGLTIGLLDLYSLDLNHFLFYKKNSDQHSLDLKVAWTISCFSYMAMMWTNKTPKELRIPKMTPLVQNAVKHTIQAVNPLKKDIFYIYRMVAYNVIMRNEERASG